MALSAGAVTWNGSSILVAGPPGTAKTSIVEWLADRGFGYLTNALVALTEDAAQLVAFGRSPDAAPPCRLVIMPTHVVGCSLKMEVIHPTNAKIQIGEGCILNRNNLPDGGLTIANAFTLATPCIALEYGDLHQLDGVLDTLARLIVDQRLDAKAARRLFSPFAPAVTVNQADAPKVWPMPEASPPGPLRKLTIGMATFDDFDGVYFSIQSMRLFHAEAMDDVEFLVIDNNPTGRCAQPLKDLEKIDSELSLRPVQCPPRQHRARRVVSACVGRVDVVHRLPRHVRARRDRQTPRLHRGQSRLVRSAARPAGRRRFDPHLHALRAGMAMGHVWRLGNRPPRRQCRRSAVRYPDAGRRRAGLSACGLARLQSALSGIRRRRRLHPREVSPPWRAHAMPAVSALAASLSATLGRALPEQVVRPDVQLHRRLPRSRTSDRSGGGALPARCWEKTSPTASSTRSRTSSTKAQFRPTRRHSARRIHIGHGFLKDMPSRDLACPRRDGSERNPVGERG